LLGQLLSRFPAATKIFPAMRAKNRCSAAQGFRAQAIELARRIAAQTGAERSKLENFPANFAASSDSSVG
jgi:hypothetical protein